MPVMSHRDARFLRALMTTEFCTTCFESGDVIAVRINFRCIKQIKRARRSHRNRLFIAENI
jgi:hypothetical protein